MIKVMGKILTEKFGETVSASVYNLTGKTNTDAICPTIYDDIIIN
jgi:hypothetical protein